MLKSIFSDRLLKAGGLVFVSAMITNVFNYLFQITMGRLLTPVEYGLMNSLLAIFMVTGVPLSTILMVVSKQTAEYKAKGEISKIRGLFQLTYKRVLSVGFLGFLIFSIGSFQIKDYIYAPSIIPVIILGLSLFITIAPLINIAVLQGMQEFRWMNLGLGLAGPFKFLFCVIFVITGFSVNGVMAGLVLASISLWVITYLPINKSISSGKQITSPDNINFMSVFPVLLANLAFAIMTQADMVLVKHFFSAHEAGIYASASILGKAVMYLPGAIVFAMFPMVAESNALQQNSRHLIKKAVVVTLLLSGFGVVMFFIASKMVMTLFFGIKYIEAAEVLKYFGIAMLPMAVLAILMNYFIAKGRTFFSYILFFGAFLEIVVIMIFHNSLMSVIFSIMGAGGFLLCIGFLLLYLEGKMEQSANQLMPKQAVPADVGK